MNSVRNLVLLVLVSTACALAAVPPSSGEVAGKIQAKIQQLKATVAAQDAADEDWKDLEPAITKLLNRADEGVRTGRIYAALDDMGKAWVRLESFKRAKMSPEVEKAGMAEFEKAWQKASVELTALNREAQKRAWNGRSIAQQALAETAQGQTVTLVEASRAYATVTVPQSGYYYLGEASGDVAVAAFDYSLHLPNRGVRIRLRSMLTEIRGLQQRINAEFKPPKSIDKHPEFIRLNATVKLARELDAAKLYAGAFYSYLSAVQQFAAMDAGEVNATQQAEVKQDLAKWKSRLASSKTDSSLGELYLQRAELWIQHEDGSTPGQDQWQAAKTVVADVLPAYEAALKAVPTVEHQTGHPVTVTLVRWPYT